MLMQSMPDILKFNKGHKFKIASNWANNEDNPSKINIVSPINFPKFIFGWHDCNFPNSYEVGRFWRSKEFYSIEVCVK